MQELCLVSAKFQFFAVYVIDISPKPLRPFLDIEPVDFPTLTT